MRSLKSPVWPRCGLETEIILRFVCETVISNPMRTRIGSTLLMGGRVRDRDPLPLPLREDSL